MVLFLVATTTTSNSTVNGNRTQGKHNNRRCTATRETEQAEMASPLSWLLIIRQLFLHLMSLIFAFCAALLLLNHNEPPWTVIYGLFYVFRSSLGGCDHWLSLQGSRLRRLKGDIYLCRHNLVIKWMQPEQKTEGVNFSFYWLKHFWHVQYADDLGPHSSCFFVDPWALPLLLP